MVKGLCCPRAAFNSKALETLLEFLVSWTLWITWAFQIQMWMPMQKLSGSKHTVHPNEKWVIEHSQVCARIISAPRSACTTEDLGIWIGFSKFMRCSMRSSFISKWKLYNTWNNGMLINVACVLLKMCVYLYKNFSPSLNKSATSR